MRYLSIVLGMLLFVSCASNEPEVTYRVEGTAEEARVTFATFENNDSSSEEVVELPWTRTINAPVGSRVAINAQNMGEEGTVEAIIEIEGQQVQRNEASGAYRMALADITVNE